MRILREAFAGIAAAITTSLLVMGAIILAITEGMVLPSAEPIDATTPPDPMGTIQFAFTTPTPPRPKPLLVAAPTQPAATTCPMPSGWEAYTVLKGDTLLALAEARQQTVALLVEKNCLPGTSLYSGSRLFLPPAPTPTQTPLTPTVTFTPTITPTKCGPPLGWVRYLVRPGDTLFKIATIYGTSWPILQDANCMGNSVMIFPGNSIYVPNVTPRYTATRVPPTRTATVVKPSPTRTFTVRPTFTFTPTPSDSPTALPPTSTFTPTATITSTPTATFTPTPIPPTATFSATPLPPSETPTPTLTSTSTFTPTGTSDPTNTSSSTATMTATNTPTGN